MIKLVSFEKYDLPVAEIHGFKPGQTLLITAGMDGDEYAGIEAAYRIIEKYRINDFLGKLVVLPLVNIRGFLAGVSINPADHKYPKHIFPGDKDGTETERLIDKIANKYIYYSSFWLDLHGGNNNERLYPYIYAYETKNKVIGEKVKKLIRHINSPRIVFVKPHFWKKPEDLARVNIPYLISEAGSKGGREETSVRFHLELASTVMRFLGMLPERPIKIKNRRIFRNYLEIRAKKTGLWFFHHTRNISCFRGQVLGETKSYRGDILEKIYCPQTGEILFRYESLSVNSGDILFQIAY